MTDATNEFISRAEREESGLNEDVVDDPLTELTFIARIRSGDLDERIPDIQAAIAARVETRRQEVLAQVHEVFGPDAQVQIPKSIGSMPGPVTPDPAESKNPFVKKAEGEAILREGPIEDTLAGLTGADEMERRMAAENGGAYVAVETTPPQTAREYIPPEQRGAIISGLHSSQIAD